MGKKDKTYLTIDYNKIGTVSASELIDALISDLQMIKDDYGVDYFSNAKLIIWASNEWATRARLCARTANR